MSIKSEKVQIMKLLRDLSYAARETHIGYDHVDQKLYEENGSFLIVVITFSRSGKTRYEKRHAVTKEQAEEIINMEIIKDSFHGCVMGNPIAKIELKDIAI